MRASVDHWYSFYPPRGALVKRGLLVALPAPNVPW